MKILLVVICAMLVATLFAGCANNENNNWNTPSMGSDGTWQANGCTIEEWIAFYDEYRTYINMSRETWISKYPG